MKSHIFIGSTGNIFASTEEYIAKNCHFTPSQKPHKGTVKIYNETQNNKETLKNYSLSISAEIVDDLIIDKV